MAFFFIGCDHENIIVEAKNNEADINETLTDVAHFLSQEQFDNSLIAFNEDNTLPLELKGISTLAQKHVLRSATVEEEIEVEEDSLICNELLLEFLNSNYEIAIGNTFFRITEQGTFFTTINNYKWLRDLSINEDMLTNCQQIEYALGYSLENGLYNVSNYNNLFFFDTFRKLDPIVAPIDLDVRATSFPEEKEWYDISDSRTLVGKAWDVWGFSKSVRNYFDKRHRVDVKFYAQRFPFYSEMGIKTKTQYRGWTGVWRKQDCNEIMNGWEMLNIKEKWPQSLLGPHFNENTRPSFTFENETVKDLSYNQTKFLAKNWKTFNIFGLYLDFSQKDKVGALWNTSKSLGKTTSKFANGKLTNPDNEYEAIRIIPNNTSTSTSRISLAPYSKGRTKTNKYTLIIANSSGGTIGVTINNNGLGYNGYTNLIAKYTFLENTILYGAARRGETWRGVRITFK